MIKSYLIYIVSLLFLQIQVTARDAGTPQRSDTIFVDVNVIRETGQLAFSLPNYQVTIPETTGLNEVIITVRANPGVSRPC